jgi:Tfp pilus assembly protein PilF
MALLANKQTDQAISALKNLTGGSAAIDAKVGLGLAYEVQGDAKSAADWYRQALAARPSDLNAQAGLSRVAPSPRASASSQPSQAAPSSSAAASS